jgi:hypothetical protein
MNPRSRQTYELQSLRPLSFSNAARNDDDLQMIGTNHSDRVINLANSAAIVIAPASAPSKL